MRRFATLYDELDRTNATNDKKAALGRYFDDVAAEDAAWAVFFLAGDRLRSPVRSADLTQWAIEAAGVERWMFDACYEAVGDRAETVALLIDAVPNRRPDESWRPTLSETVTWLESLKGQLPEVQKAALQDAWARGDVRHLFLLTKLMTGGLRVGVGKRLLVRALAEWADIDAQVVFHRLMGQWTPSADGFRGLFEADTADADASRPYPYFLASPLDEAGPDASALGDPADWLAEWKWDGIRAQLVRRAGQTWLWSRGEELVTGQYPEIAAAAELLPDGTVLDGEILAYADGAPRPFADLQRRIGRKRIGAKILADVPCVFMAFDQLEVAGRDVRAEPLQARRASLEATLGSDREQFPISPVLAFEDWQALAAHRAQSRTRGVEGLLLKRRTSVYAVGRVRGDWWKWKIEPLEIDAVLVYAQPGHGRRASLYTDYTFAVWNDARELVPVAKAYTGLSDAEIRELDRWIRANTVEKFGPVRSVEPTHVFELHFENVARSARHKSGVAVRFPRIARWRRDRTPADIAELADLEGLIADADPD